MTLEAAPLRLMILPFGRESMPSWAGRHQQLSFRGLLKVHSRYGLPGCCSPKGLHLFPRLQREGLPVPLLG
jgi:hypothetical protein